MNKNLDMLKALRYQSVTCRESKILNPDEITDHGFACQIQTMDLAIKYMEKEIAANKRIYKWLLGYTTFPTRKGGGPYYWRTNLRDKLKKIGIEFK